MSKLINTLSLRFTIYQMGILMRIEVVSHIKCLDEGLALSKWQCIEHSLNYNQGNALLQSLKDGSQQGILRAAFSHSTGGCKNELMGFFPPNIHHFLIVIESRWGRCPGVKGQDW